MKYIEGVIKDISRKGVWRRGRLEGTYNFRDVIAIETYIELKTISDEILLLKCPNEMASKHKINEAVSISYDKDGIREIHINNCTFNNLTNKIMNNLLSNKARKPQ